MLHLTNHPFGENEREFIHIKRRVFIININSSSIFSPNSDLIDSEKDIEILNSNSDFFRNNSQSNFNGPICLNELIMALKRLKNEAASGPDQINNLILNNLPRNSLIEIIELFNLSLQEGRVPKAWKTSNITLIQKKASSLQDPLNYRSISITSCLGKLLERIYYGVGKKKNNCTGLALETAIRFQLLIIHTIGLYYIGGSG
ncbi:RNA-directed DNA polymerase from mobile element jockey-like [Brachionus plicatilis]|uniref:RNA-directed DNA polymerase from mobile element jockey-like n=1 Tax=Brachionus plicatilis TaxID=10195 RepID=A0A3M7SPH8_BRAPC|nr:RNA-directed DNA polymerase from mobile element jockey-like [Brachionus plicatilis]